MKRFLICGCSHGGLADRSALKSILDFKRDFKPHFTAHLGDFCDTTAWRSGAKGSSDEGASVPDDLNHGLDFLEKLRPQAVLIGNHEHRIYKHAEHPNAIIREAARSTIGAIREVIVDGLGAKFVETYSLEKSWLRMGNYLIGHGVFFSEQAVRDHAERMGNCIIAHLHRQEVARGRRLGGPTCVSVGYLGDKDKFTYADTNASKFRWQTGWCYGEFSDTNVEWQLHQHFQTRKANEYQSV